MPPVCGGVRVQAQDPVRFLVSPLPRAFGTSGAAVGGLSAPVGLGRTGKRLRERLLLCPHHPRLSGEPCADALWQEDSRLHEGWCLAHSLRAGPSAHNRAGPRREWEVGVGRGTPGFPPPRAYLRAEAASCLPLLPRRVRASNWLTQLLSHHSSLLLPVLITLTRVVAVTSDVF